jgi:hypothetical protein
LVQLAQLARQELQVQDQLALLDYRDQMEQLGRRDQQVLQVHKVFRAQPVLWAVQVLPVIKVIREPQELLEQVLLEPLD